MKDTKDKRPLATSQGMSVDSNLRSMSAGERGATPSQDVSLIDKLAHHDRERLPDRRNHTCRTYTINHDITMYSKAKIFNNSHNERSEHYE